MNHNPIIFGIDILSRTDKNHRGILLFSLVVLANDHMDKYPKLNKRSLAKKIFNINPDFIAIDNIFELAPDAKGIIRFLNIIPPTTSLVQVTGNPRTGMEKIHALVQKHHLKKVLSFSISSSKMDSLETAEVCAYLCKKKVGHEVVAFEEEIRIVISKRKSHGHGGWSAPRYERISRTAVDQAASAVENLLKDFKLDAEVYEYPNRRVYLVQLEKRKIHEIQNQFKSLNTELVRIDFERISKSNLEFRPLDTSLAPASRTLHNIILGIDPGTTTGIAIVDCLKGQMLYLSSKRECGISQIIRIASKFGKICCVAADVVPPPAMVEKIAQITGAKLLSPSTLTSAAQKREYLQDYRDLTVDYGHLNSHERDALYGALRAYNSLKDQLIKIKRSIELDNPELQSYIPEVQRMVLAGNNIANAIEIVKEQVITKDGLESKPEYNGVKISLTQEIGRLQTKIDFFYEEMDNLDREASYWKKQSKRNTLEAKRWKEFFEREKVRTAKYIQNKINNGVNREVGRIKSENQEIRRQIRENLKEMEKLKQIKNFWVQGREIPLKVVKSFSDDSIRTTVRDYGLNEGDIVLVLNPSGGGAQTALKLIDYGIKGVIIPEETPNFSDQALNQFNDNSIPVLVLPLEEFSKRERDENNPKLKIWVYDELYLIDIGVKEEIRKIELKLHEQLRKKRRLEIIKKTVSEMVSSGSEIDLDKILDEFKQEYISQYYEEIEEFIHSLDEEE